MTVTLTLPEAAKLLRVHKTTLRLRAAAGDVPGAKVGRAWTFIESDLLAHLRSQYQCPSTSNAEVKSGGSTSRTPVTHGYVSRLENMIAMRRKKSTMSAKRLSGKSIQP